MFIKLFQAFLLLALFVASPALADVTVFENGVVRPENRMDIIPVEAQTEIGSSTNVITEYKPENSKSKKSSKPNVIYKSPKVNYNDRGDGKVIEKPFESVGVNELGEKPKIKEDCDNNNYVCIITYAYKNYILLEARNKSVSARTVDINYVLNNMKSELGSENKYIILKPNESKFFDRLTPINLTKSYGFNYNYSSYFGVVDAIAEDYVYDLPYDLGKNLIVLQGAGGRFTHSGENVYYSYDFKMPVGSDVLAARDGVVVRIVDSFKEGGVNPAFKGRENFIYIQHADGTIANYAHIKYKGALTSVGAFVQKGDKIALSGNTGYTTDPHLHFGVFKVVKGGKHKSVPIRFKTSKGVVRELKAGGFYEK